MKILFPDQKATTAEIRELLSFAIEGRKRVKDQLLRIDQTFEPVRFAFKDKDGNEVVVKALEESQYPNDYYPGGGGETDDESETVTPEPMPGEPTAIQQVAKPKEGHLVIHENHRGIRFDDLFGPYVSGAKKIVLTDPYIRMFHQARSLMEFIETVVRFKGDENVEVELITVEEEFKTEQQLDFFQQIQKNCIPSGILFSWKFEPQTSIHARHIVIDNGWKIILDRGLDVFQRYEMNDAFSLSNRLQEHRSCKPFEITYLRHSG